MGYKTFEDMKHNIPEGATHYRNECESFLFTWFKETDIGIKFYEEVSQNWRFIGRHVNNLKSKMVKIPSQIETPEEKEALDMIDTTSKQVESLASNSEFPNGSEYDRAAGGPIKLSPPEWNGEGLPYSGVECEFKCEGFWGDSEYHWCRFLGLLTDKSYAIEFHHYTSPDRVTCGCFDPQCTSFRKPETHEQKAERERLEMVKKACLTVRHDYGLMPESGRNFLEKYGMEWLKAFEKLGCIKELK